MTGTDGRIEMQEAFVNPPDRASFTVETSSGRSEVMLPPAPLHQTMVEELTADILDERPPCFDPYDPVRNMSVLEACLQSARLGRRVDIPPRYPK